VSAAATAVPGLVAPPVGAAVAGGLLALGVEAGAGTGTGASVDATAVGAAGAGVLAG
jgi:hypothetical protein